MKKLPNIPICGRTFKVKYDTRINGASFTLNPAVIVVNPNDSKEDLKHFLMHEIFEIIMTSRLHRYQIYDEGNNKLLFSFNHNEFDNIIRDLLPLLDVKCLKGVK